MAEKSECNRFKLGEKEKLYKTEIDRFIQSNETHLDFI